MTSSDSVHIGLDGVGPTSGYNVNGFKTNAWSWSNRSNGNVRTIEVTSTGIHSFDLWMRESGMIVDKIVITNDPNYVPSGLGPDESPSGDDLPTVDTPSISPAGGLYPNPVEITLFSNTPLAQIYYTLDGSPPLDGNGPTVSAQLYSGSFNVDLNATVTAMGTLSGYNNSAASAADFSIGNPSPILSPVGNQSGIVDQLLSFTVNASDADGSIPVMSAELSQLPTGASFIDQGNGRGVFNWTPDNSDLVNSPYSVTFTATDALDANVTTTETISITVADIPVVVALQQGTDGIVSIEAESFEENLSGSDGHAWMDNNQSGTSGIAMRVLP